MMRAGSPWDIAEACVYLAGPSGKFVTGETLTVDGGGQLWGETWTTGKPEYFGVRWLRLACFRRATTGVLRRWYDERIDGGQRPMVQGV